MKHRIAVSTLATALMFVSIGAQALWARLSESELIDTSGLIVVGTLTEITSETNPSDGQARSFGVIEIDRVLKGDPATKTARLNRPRPGAFISSSDIIYKVGQKGLWYLRLLEPQSAAVYAADHPQRFVPFADAGPHIEAVLEYLDR